MRRALSTWGFESLRLRSGNPNKRGVAQSGRALRSGRRGPRFESGRPDYLREGAACPRFRLQDGWPSGLRRTTGNRVGICPRGFESHPVRERERTDGVGFERCRAGGGRAARRGRRRRLRTAEPPAGQSHPVRSVELAPSPRDGISRLSGAGRADGRWHDVNLKPPLRPEFAGHRLERFAQATTPRITWK